MNSTKNTPLTGADLVVEQARIFIENSEPEIQRGRKVCSGYHFNLLKVALEQVKSPGKAERLPREHRPILVRYLSWTNTKPSRIKVWVKDHPAGAREYSAHSFDTAEGQHTYHEAAKRYAAEIGYPQPEGHVVNLDARNAAVI